MVISQSGCQWNGSHKSKNDWNYDSEMWVSVATRESSAAHKSRWELWSGQCSVAIIVCWVFPVCELWTEIILLASRWIVLWCFGFCNVSILAKRWGDYAYGFIKACHLIIIMLNLVMRNIEEALYATLHRVKRHSLSRSKRMWPEPIPSWLT